MLVENPQANLIKLRDAVKIMETGEVGTVTGFTDGKWTVELAHGGVVQVREGGVQKRAVLHG